MAKRKCPRCGRPMKKDEVLMSISYKGETTGKFCGHCLIDKSKVLSNFIKDAKKRFTSNRQE